MKENSDQELIELKKFVEETLVQIVKGVKASQDDIKNIGGEICPTGLYFSGGSETRVIYKPGKGIVQTVEFDIALTVTKATALEGKAGIAIHIASAGGETSLEKTREALNRVKFTVPVLLPSEFYDWGKEMKPKLEGHI